MTQPEALGILKLGENVFLTGPAGSGKTFLLNQYVEYLKRHGIPVAVTASTGVAATHLNGRTIHSWCGMRISEQLTKQEMRLLQHNEELSTKIKRTKVLIIDEISMLNASRLDLANNICQVIRQDLRPFGGMQIVLCGDFFQLPPVVRDKNKEDGRFVVESDIWQQMDVKICYLEEQYRQEDKKFLQVLNAIRGGKVNKKINDILNQRMNQPISNGKMSATKLHTHNGDVDAYNAFELENIKGESVAYQMKAVGPPPLVKFLQKNCLAPEILELKIGAIVMFLRNNFNQKYVNGTMGKVIGFDPDDRYPIVETSKGGRITARPEKWLVEDGGEELAYVSQVPLRLAWAITVHKSQGMSLDFAEIDLSRTFEYGMGYVALSRVRSLDGIKLVGINEKALLVNAQVAILDKELFARSHQDLLNYKQLGKRAVKAAHEHFAKHSHKKNVLDDLVLDI
jgi:ATP-dependent exoDNAse (exonuclease V) alpha subunit